MLSKKKRITKNTFQSVMKKGSVVNGSFFLFRYLKQESPQFAFVVPKKIAKTAVKRNYLRRKGYNIIKSYVFKQYVGIFFYKKEALNAPSVDLKKDIDFIFKKTGII